jgi:hypothetical protein
MNRPGVAKSEQKPKNAQVTPKPTMDVSSVYYHDRLTYLSMTDDFRCVKQTVEPYVNTGRTEAGGTANLWDGRLVAIAAAELLPHQDNRHTPSDGVIDIRFEANDAVAALRLASALTAAAVAAQIWVTRYWERGLPSPIGDHTVLDYLKIVNAIPAIDKSRDDAMPLGLQPLRGGAWSMRGEGPEVEQEGRIRINDRGINTNLNSEGRRAHPARQAGGRASP